MRDIKVKETKHARYKWQVIVPKSMFGKHQRLSYRSKSRAVAKKDELENDYKNQKLCPLNKEHHLCAARYQDLLTASQMEEALSKAVGYYKLRPKTVGDLAAEYRDKAAADLKINAIDAQTQHDIEIRSNQIIRWVGEKPARDFTKDDVASFVEARVDDGYAPRSVKNYVITLSCIMGFGVDCGCLHSNPVRGQGNTYSVRLPKDKAAGDEDDIADVSKIVNPDDLAVLISNAANEKTLRARDHHDDPGTSAMLNWIMFGAFAGLRSSETRRLRWEDIRLDEGQLFVRGRKTKNATRWVQLTPPLVDYCKRMLEKPREGLVMLGRVDSHLNKMRHTLYESTGGAVVPHNGLRTSYASHHLVHHASPEQTATEMGHWSPQQTYDAYRRAVTKSQAKTYWELRADL